MSLGRLGLNQMITRPCSRLCTSCSSVGAVLYAPSSAGTTKWRPEVGGFELYFTRSLGSVVWSKRAGRLHVLELAAGRRRGLREVELLLLRHGAAAREHARVHVCRSRSPPASTKTSTDHDGQHQHEAAAVAHHPLARLGGLGLALTLLALAPERLLLLASAGHGGEA